MTVGIDPWHYVFWYWLGEVFDALGWGWAKRRWGRCEVSCCLDDGCEGVWYEFFTPMRFRRWRRTRHWIG